MGRLIFILSGFILSGCMTAVPPCAIERSSDGWTLVSSNADIRDYDFGPDSYEVHEWFRQSRVRVYRLANNRYHFCQPSDAEIPSCGQLSANSTRSASGEFTDTNLELIMC